MSQGDIQRVSFTGCKESAREDQLAEASRASPRIVGRLGVWFGPRSPCVFRGPTAQALDQVWLRAVLRACLVAQLRLQN